MRSTNLRVNKSLQGNTAPSTVVLRQSHTPSAAIAAAEHCIAVLERGGSIGTDQLQVLCIAVGEPCEMLMRRVRVGWMPVGSVERVIERLEDYIDDLRLEASR